MFDGTQPELPLFDPTEPRVLPQDRRAYFTINWLSPAGRLDRQWAFEADEIETVLRLTAGQPNLYISHLTLEQARQQKPPCRWRSKCHQPSPASARPAVGDR
jgi:hypothetical protein